MTDLDLAEHDRILAEVPVGEKIIGKLVAKLTTAEARIAALEAAARAVVDAASFSTNAFPLLCRICASPDALHSQSCPVGKLAALLEPTEAERAMWAAELALSKEMP